MKRLIQEYEQNQILKSYSVTVFFPSRSCTEIDFQSRFLFKYQFFTCRFLIHVHCTSAQVAASFQKAKDSPSLSDFNDFFVRVTLQLISKIESFILSVVVKMQGCVPNTIKYSLFTFNLLVFVSIFTHTCDIETAVLLKL